MSSKISVLITRLAITFVVVGARLPRRLIARRAPLCFRSSGVPGTGVTDAL